MAEPIKNAESRENLVAFWCVPLRDGVHTVEFEHGSTSGKRVLRVDGQVIHFNYRLFIRTFSDNIFRTTLLISYNEYSI